jgi:hypothetical protein
MGVTTAVAAAMITMSKLDFMGALKVLERYVREAMSPVTQAEIMEKAARKLERLQQETEMQADIDRALVRPSAPRLCCGGTNQVRRLAWLESFEPEGGLRAQVDVAARAMGLADDNKRAEVALETHNRDADSSMRGHIPPDGVLDHCLFTPAGSWVLYAPPPPPATVFRPVPVVSTAVTWR